MGGDEQFNLDSYRDNIINSDESGPASQLNWSTGAHTRS